MLASNFLMKALHPVGSSSFYPNPCMQVKETCYLVSQLASHVHINTASIHQAAENIINEREGFSLKSEIEWDSGGWHYTDGGPRTCQYVFVMDALNFCFWPVPGLEYDVLAKSLKKVLEDDKDAFDAVKLSQITEESLSAWFPDYQLPLLSERVKCIRELGEILHQEYDGRAINMVNAAEGSAVKLVKLILQHFSRFRDTAIYRGQLIYFYKRAQILVGDIWAAYGKQKDIEHPCCFADIDALTMFADYRVPQILRSMGVLLYSPALAASIDSHEEIPWGDEREVELRAQTIVAVDMLQQELRSRGKNLLVLECDWLLWQQGERLKDHILPHHRTLSIYY